MFKEVYSPHVNENGHHEYAHRQKNTGLCKLMNRITIGAQQLVRPPAGSATRVGRVGPVDGKQSKEPT